MDNRIFRNELLSVGEFTLDGLNLTHFYVDIAGSLHMVERFVKTYGGNIEVKYGKLTYRMLRKDFALMIKVADLSDQKLKELALRFQEEVKFEKGTEITL